MLLGVLREHLADIELAADAAAILDLPDRVLGQYRGVRDALTAAANEPPERDHRIGDRLLDEVLAVLAADVAKSEAGVLDDGRNHRLEFLMPAATRGLGDAGEAVAVDIKGDLSDAATLGRVAIGMG